MIPIQSITVGPSSGSWVFTWANLSTTYRVVLWGNTLATITTPTYIWNGQYYTSFPPPLEIVLQGEEALSEQFSPYLVMQWYGEPTCATYQIQKYVGTVWQTVANQTEVGQWVYTYQSPVLADETIYKYRVLAQDNLGNSSTPQIYQKYIVTPPAPPDPTLSITYAGGSIEIVTN